MSISIDYKNKSKPNSELSCIDIIISGNSKERKIDLNKLYEEIPSLKDKIKNQVEEQSLDSPSLIRLDVKSLSTYELEKLSSYRYKSTKIRNEALDDLIRRNIERQREKYQNPLFDHPKDYSPYRNERY